MALAFLLLGGLFVYQIIALNSHNVVLTPVWYASSEPALGSSSGSSPSALNIVAWSPDAQYIATAGNRGKVEVWDVEAKHIICTYSGHKGAILALAWSHDGTRLASGGTDHTVQVWLAENCHHIFTYIGHQDAVNTVAWSPHDIRIASGSDDETVKVWDVVDGVTVYTYSGQHYAISSVAWSADGERIASIANNTKNQLQVWDATTGSNVLSATLDPGQGENTVAWSPDGTRIAFNVGGVVQIRDASSMGKIVSITCSGDQNDVNAVAWSPSSIYIASGGSDNTVSVCDSTTGSNVAICRGHSGSVNSLEWASGGKSYSLCKR